MNAAKPQKAVARNTRGKPTRLPPVADYSDIVTDEQFARIANLVPKEEYEGAEVVSGPAW